MCDVDTITNDDGTVTVFCCCGWSEIHDAPGLADMVGEWHQNHMFDIDLFDDGELDASLVNAG